jgi:hypothetical protein
MFIETIKMIEIFLSLGIILYILNIFYKFINKIYLLKNKLLSNNCIIIWNKPYRTFINNTILLIFEYICNGLIFDMDYHDDIIKKIKNNNVNNIILDTIGGDVSSSDILIDCILTSKLKLTIHVPRKAQSAGTLLAFSANTLYIDKNAYLGPTDPQISFEGTTYSIKSFMELCDNKDTNFITDKYLLSYYENKKLYDENIKLITKLLENKFKKNTNKLDRNNLIYDLTSGTKSHHMPFSGLYLSKYLNINLCLPNNIVNIFNLFEYITNFL